MGNNPSEKDKNDSGGSNEEEKKEERSEEEISGPLCFSCSKCRTIVGDSFSFLTSNEEAQTITLTASSNIKRSADVYTSKGGFDVGSTYFNFTCSNCQELLGRYYLTTSKDLDELREKFTFLVTKIQSYELGKAQNGKMPEPVAEDGQDGSDQDDAAKSGGLQDQGMVEALGNMQKEILKVQHVLVGVLERIEKVESRFMQPQQSQADPGWGVTSGNGGARKRKAQ